LAATPPNDRSPAPPWGFAAFAPESPLRLRPTGLLEGAVATAAIEQGRALPLSGGPLAFTEVEALARKRDGSVASAFGTVADLLRWSAEQWPSVGERVANALAAIVAPRRRWAGLALDRPRLMGVLGVTADGAASGGDAIEHGRALLGAGADIIDIRRGGAPTSPEEEIRHVEPVVRALVAAGALVSVETRHAAVMRAALAAGARIICGVTAADDDKEGLAVAAESGAAVLLTHMAAARSASAAAPDDDPALDVLDYLEASIAACEAAAMPREWIVVDPGIGFGKADPHDRALLARLTLLHATGCAVALSASRQSFIARLSRGEPPKERLGGSLAAALWAASQGVQVLRVHDVAETRQALAIRQAIVRGAPLALS
jgi:dihydropteroate synthase